MNIPGMASLLTLTSDKKAYRAGEKIKITFPSSEGSVALVSVENGKTVKDIFRVPTSAGSTSFEIDANSEMCPNIMSMSPSYNPTRTGTTTNRSVYTVY